MSIKISYQNKISDKISSNIVLFVNEKFNTSSIKKFLTESEISYISDLLKTSDLNKDMFLYEVNSKKKIVLISIKKDFKNSDIENLGAKFYERINYGKSTEYFINSDSASSKYNNFLGYFLHGLKLKSYEFNKYKTKKENRIISIFISGSKNKPSSHTQLKFKSLEEGTFFARDLVSEPGNVLHPDEYAKRVSALKKRRVKS